MRYVFSGTAEWVNVWSVELSAERLQVQGLTAYRALILGTAKSKNNKNMKLITKLIRAHHGKVVFEQSSRVWPG